MLGNECGFQHNFFRLWPISPEVRDAVAVTVGDEIRLKKAWLDDLRARWQAVPELEA